MEFLVTLLLISLLFSGVLSLMCQQCIPLGFAPCTSTQINCSTQCATATVYFGDSRGMNINVQTCSTPDLCVNGSLNTGIINVINTAECCSTNFCNNKTLPAPSQQSSNGIMCYTCDPKGCYRTLNCVGDQNRCITSSVKQGVNTVFMKGCASKSFCDIARPTSVGIATVNVTCCEGNLCNAAELFTLRLFLMIVPLLSSILFY